MNNIAEIAVDVRDAVKRYGEFTALQKTPGEHSLSKLCAFPAHDGTGKRGLRS